MILIEVLIVLLLCLAFINVFILAGIINRLNALEKITRETITLIGKTAMVSMNMGAGMKFPISDAKPSHNPLVG